MWLPKSHSNFYGGDGQQRKGTSVVAVAIDKDKNSQHALKWSVENLLTRGQTVILLHVNQKTSTPAGGPDASPANKPLSEKQTRDLFVIFRCFCTRKDIQCIDVTLDDSNIAKALAEYASQYAIEYLVLGASSRHGFIRFKGSDVPTNVMKAAPDFCTIYVISKGKISSAKKSLRAPPFVSPLLEQIQEISNNAAAAAAATAAPAAATTTTTTGFSQSTHNKNGFHTRGAEKTPEKRPPMPVVPLDDPEPFRSPFTRPGRNFNSKFLLGDLAESDTDISFVSSGRPSSDRMSVGLFYDTASLDSGSTSRHSTSSDYSFGSPYVGGRASDVASIQEFSSNSMEARGSSASQNVDDADTEMKRLKMELMKTMDLYSSACKEALTAKQKAGELQRWRMLEQQKMEEVRVAEEEAKENIEKEKAKCQAAMEKAEASKRIAELEAQKRVSAEMKELSQSEHTEDPDYVPENQYRYRRYMIEEIEEATEYFSESRKIGEGGYGPVFKGRLSHTPVAIKVLRPDAAQGRSQFQREVEVLSCMRHPNMVLLLGACPEYGCLVYEYMANGSLDDRLFRRGNTRPLSWQIRFKIAAEIATGILFLHQTKPEPIVHRDLKPANILLDQNFVSKISDVGLARLLPPSLAEDITQYRMTSTAGTFCYIDPEYQQTGMLGVKSDVYSLGIMLLQLITARPAMGLAHHVRNAIERGNFADFLDPLVPDWPQDEALGFAKLALQCAELMRKDRPDLGKVVLPELSKLRDLGEERMPSLTVFANSGPAQDTKDPPKSDANPPGLLYTTLE